jgi:purine catabolism regulator
VALTADVTDDMLLHCAAPKVLIGVSSPTSATGIQRALQESLWALGSANGNAMNLVRYADGPSWLGLTSFEEGTALVQRLLGPIFMTETSTLTQLWFALQIHEAMHN